MKSRSSIRSPLSYPERLAARKGAFVDGYTPQDVSRVCTEIRDSFGLEIGILWDYYDDCGYGGNSDFVLIDGAKVYEVDAGLEELSAFLHGDGECPSFLELRRGKLRHYHTENDYNYAVEDRP